jgi:rRNA-processing protein EBP2
MAKRSKLLLALDAHKGRDYEGEKRKKQIKAAVKRKKQRVQATQTRPDSEEEGTEPKQNDITSPLPAHVKTAAPGQSDNNNDFEDYSGSKVDDKEAGGKDDGGEEAEDPSASEAESESDVPLSDLSEDERADTIPHQRMTINNGPALKTSTARIRLIQPHLRFSAHNSLISSLPPSSTAIPDPNDDLTRELEFYRIARAAATKARALLKKEGVPFTRPSDYFAEMAKSDEQMEKVKRKMRDEAASKKAAAEARALRDAKKFGKAVQVAKVQERAREKKDMLEKISMLKRST